MATAPHADIAHVLRRLTFGPFPGQVEALAATGDGKAAAAAVLSAAPSPIEPPALGSDDDEELLVTWWLERMADPAAGLAEKMTWFWHGHLTSGFDKVGEPRFLWAQHQLLRREALGGFRDLLHGITSDVAMLQYLDGADSTGDAPNENYARELMELFALGSGTFTEADVRSGARALAGFVIDDHGKVRLDPTRTYRGALRFLGRTGQLGAADVVDIVCDNGACAPHIARSVHRFLLGYEPAPARVAELAAVFRASDLQIAPLVAAMVEHPDFWSARARYSRPRHPVEWLAPATVVLGWRPDGLDVVRRMGQVPFHPPNVSGWPDPTRWISPGSSLVRAAVAYQLADDSIVSDAADPAGWALGRAAIFDASPTTRRALESAAASIDSRRERASVLLALAVCSPEFVLA